MFDNILDLLDFKFFDVYVNYMKGKQTIKRIFEPNKTLEILKLIHTDIYESFSIFA